MFDFDACLAFVNDIHSGSIYGLVPPGGFILNTGSRVSPSHLQQIAIDHWGCFWDRRKKEGLPMALFLGGDLGEGHHHQSTEILGSPKLQIDNALELLREPANLAQFIFSVNGTPVHCGNEGNLDDIVAQQIGATEVYGRRSNYHIRVDVFGCKVDFCHFGPTRGKKPWNRENQLVSYVKGIMVQNIDTGREVPDLVVRCHRHKKLECMVEYEGRHTYGFLSPAWQWRTEHGHIVSTEDQIADIGGLVVYVKDGRVVDYYFDCVTVEDVPLAKF